MQKPGRRRPAQPGRSRRTPSPVLRILVATGLALATPLLLPPPVAAANPARHAAAAGSEAATSASSRWVRAQQSREALEKLPQAARTHAAYARVIENYRAIYHEDPADLHAPASIFAVANLLAEQGRALHLQSSSAAAASEYRFLRTQYPASSLIPQALLAEAQVEQTDLSDPAAARDRYTLLLREHPRTRQAQAARLALNTPAPAPSTSQAPTPTASACRSPLPAMATTADLSASNRVIRVPPEIPQNSPQGSHAEAPASLQPQTGPASATARPTSAPANRHPALVSSVRHWSTPDYTRVAIDLGDDITFEAARVPHPDRLLFDLHGARLAPKLSNKSFVVTDRGFLSRIRLAQEGPDTARVVLDVSEISEYSAFLLPNPCRLIIDIHGRGADANPADGTVNDVRSLAERTAAAQTIPAGHQQHGGSEVEAPSAPGAASRPLASVPSPVPAPRTGSGENATAAKPVPSTVSSKYIASGSELDALGRDPGRVEASAKPTSRAVAVTVAPAGKGKHDSRRSANEGSQVGRPVALPLPIGAPGIPARAAAPTALGQTSLVRALGLKIERIVIDAGHGGHDSGTLGVGGLQEKDVVLDVALRLGKLLHDRVGAEVIYTRSDDTFVPLETRTAIANKAQADLFLSIHANSSPDESARGVETYYLNFTNQGDALEVAARENAVSGQSVHQLSDLVKKIALKDKIEESREFAGDVERSLYGGLVPGNSGLKDRGVKKAPFVVLIGANMPSILAEISFVTNERDAEQLRRPEYRQRVAESLFKGVAKYEAGLGDNRLALERATGN